MLNYLLLLLLLLLLLFLLVFLLVLLVVSVVACWLLAVVATHYCYSCLHTQVGTIIQLHCY